MTKKEKVGLNLIYSHAGRQRVYETYLKVNPEMVNQKTLLFSDPILDLLIQYSK